MCVYLLLPWDLHSKQGLLFNGTIIKCAVSKHWWFVLSPVYSPIRLIPRTAPFPHSAAFLDVNTSKSLAAKHWLKHSWENRNILLVMCGTLFSPPQKIPSSACQVQKGSRGPHQLDVLSFRLQNTIISTCSFFPFILVISWLDLISLPRAKIHTFQTSPNFLHPIAPFQLFVATLVSSLPFWLAKCVIPLAWYSYSHANPLRYPHLSRGNW